MGEISKKDFQFQKPKDDWFVSQLLDQVPISFSLGSGGLLGVPHFLLMPPLLPYSSTQCNPAVYYPRVTHHSLQEPSLFPTKCVVFHTVGLPFPIRGLLFPTAAPSVPHQTCSVPHHRSTVPHQMCCVPHRSPTVPYHRSTVPYRRPFPPRSTQDFLPPLSPSTHLTSLSYPAPPSSVLHQLVIFLYLGPVFNVFKFFLHFFGCWSIFNVIVLSLFSMSDLFVFE